MAVEFNQVGWFEIPALDLERARQFYGNVFGIALQAGEMGPMRMALFPMKAGAQGAAGSLVAAEGLVPADVGTLVYFTVADIDGACERAATAGGSVLRGKTDIGEHGHIALIRDTEGNRIGLHTRRRAEEETGADAVYRSRSIGKSLWQEYRVCPDRVEFDTHFGMMTIPFDHIESVEVSESEVRGLMRGDLHLKNFRPALKLDWANFLEHVVLDKRAGHIRRVLFTPEDPAEFTRALEEAIEQHRLRENASRGSTDM